MPPGTSKSANRAQLTEAKRILDKLLDANPKPYPPYRQLARAAMKLNGGPQGLHQAHDLLTSALQIKPDGVNAKSLLGYVHAHERHSRRATGLFPDAAAANPQNLWLWSNWGEMERRRPRNAAAAPSVIRRWRCSGA